MHTRPKPVTLNRWSQHKKSLTTKGSHIVARVKQTKQSVQHGVFPLNNILLPVRITRWANGKTRTAAMCKQEEAFGYISLTNRKCIGRRRINQKSQISFNLVS